MSVNEPRGVWSNDKETILFYLDEGSNTSTSVKGALVIESVSKARIVSKGSSNEILSH